jgi:subtilisin family serine protease
MTRAPTLLAAWIAAAVCCVLATGCATPRVVSRDLDATARSQPERLIVVAVRNEAVVASSPAGSTPRGYRGTTRYAVSAQAQRNLMALAKEYELTRIAEWPIEVLTAECAVYRVPDGRSRDDIIARLKNDARVTLVQPMQSFATRAEAKVEALAPVQHSLRQMDIVGAHRQSLGQGIRIAVIDTGLDSAHPDLKGRIAGLQNFVDRDAQQFNLDRHGTIVGGVIAANRNAALGISGVAPAAQLLALKACWQLEPGRDDAACNSYTLAQALAKAIELRAQVINLSLTGPYDPLLAALVGRALTAGIVVVGPGAASSASPMFPDSLPNIIHVVRADSPLTSKDTLRAPGTEVLALVPGADYSFASGDSIAVANVSGIAALLLAAPVHPEATTVRQLLQSAAGESSINACEALVSLAGSGHCH